MGGQLRPYISLLAEHSCHPLVNGPRFAGMQSERFVVGRRPRPGDGKRARPRLVRYDDLAAACVAIHQTGTLYGSEQNQGQQRAAIKSRPGSD
jgi:hypothetical protein